MRSSAAPSVALVASPQASSAPAAAATPSDADNVVQVWRFAVPLPYIVAFCVIYAALCLFNCALLARRRWRTRRLRQPRPWRAPGEERASGKRTSFAASSRRHSAQPRQRASATHDVALAAARAALADSRRRSAEYMKIETPLRRSREHKYVNDQLAAASSAVYVAPPSAVRYVAPHSPASASVLANAYVLGPLEAPANEQYGTLKMAKEEEYSVLEMKHSEEVEYKQLCINRNPIESDYLALELQ